MSEDAIIELARLYRAVEAKVKEEQRGELYPEKQQESEDEKQR
jgi:hypothetical protein